MIDTHSHLLPGIDHGCPDLETSLLMAREAATSGIHTVVCTPHLTELDAGFVRLAREVLEEVRSALVREGIEVRLILGFEVDLSIAATSSPEVLRSLAIESSGGAILLEMPYQGWPVFMEETVFRLRMAGFVPVLAHPERNDRIQDAPGMLSRCLSAGAVAQATVASLGGEFGRGSERAFFTLLARGDISLLATDAHGFRTGGWTFEPAFTALEDRASIDDLTRLTRLNPEVLLSGGRPAAVILRGKAALVGPTWRDRVKFPKLRRTEE